MRYGMVARDNAQQPELGSEEFPVARKAPTPVSVRYHASVHAVVNGIDDLEDHHHVSADHPPQLRTDDARPRKE
jgi:hypothetical protein